MANHLKNDHNDHKTDAKNGLHKNAGSQGHHEVKKAGSQHEQAKQVHAKHDSKENKTDRKESNSNDKW